MRMIITRIQIMFFSSILLWIGCVFVYLASPHQKLITKPYPQKISYSVFIVLVICSWVGFSQVYSMLISALFVLTLIMVMWGITVFLLGHIKIKLISYLIGGSVISLLLTQLGGV